MYDLLLKGGTVVDPSQGLSGIQDVAVKGGAVARIEPYIPDDETKCLVELRGRFITPGLIDLHTHVYDGVNSTGVNPDVAGVYSGVTTVVDAGSAGCDTFAGFPQHVIPNSHTDIICFLHIGRTGLATGPDIFSSESIDLEGAIRVAITHEGLICGIKARMVSPALEIMGMEMPRLAKRAATESGTRLMVHIGDTEQRYDPSVIQQLLPMMDGGDIVTHSYTANLGGLLDVKGKVIPEAKEAMDRGVWFDTAHGRKNFSFDVAQRLLDQDFVPHCISTDLTLPGRLNTVHSMTEMMSRFLALGFSLEQVVTMCTANPARAIGEDNRMGSLAVGRQADISVIEIKNGDWILHDVVGGTLRSDKAVVPVLTVKRGQVFTPSWGPRPWGWEPDRALD